MFIVPLIEATIYAKACSYEEMHAGIEAKEIVAKEIKSSQMWCTITTYSQVPTTRRITHL
jgi:hypothetical protein